MLDPLLRELVRTETRAAEHATRQARRIGDAAPVVALRDVAVHANNMRPRLAHLLEAQGINALRPSLASAMSALRCALADRVHDAERAYRGALADLRHGIELVRTLRDLAKQSELFGWIRWCDDWLSARRTLVARVEAQLAWFAVPHPGAPLADPREPVGG